MLAIVRQGCPLLHSSSLAARDPSNPNKQDLIGGRSDGLNGRGVELLPSRVGGGERFCSGVKPKPKKKKTLHQTGGWRKNENRCVQGTNDHKKRVKGLPDKGVSFQVKRGPLRRT